MSSRIPLSTQSKIIVVIIIFVSIFLATEITAALLGFPKELGNPILILNRSSKWLAVSFNVILLFATGCILVKDSFKFNNLCIFALCFSVLNIFVALIPIYNPLGFFLWLFKWGDRLPESTWYPGISLIFFSALCAGIYYSKIMRSKIQNSSDLHGSAEFANEKEIEETQLLNNNLPYSVYVGAWQNPKTSVIHYLRYSGESNIFALAPPRSGKGAGFVIPTLLSYEGNCIHPDVKLENWHYTAGFRKAMGQTVLKFDFNCDDGSAACFNPLLEVRQGIYEVRDVQNIVDMISDPDGRGKGDHWTDTANDLMVSIILHVLYVEKDKSLPGIRNFISNLHMQQEELFKHMISTIHDPEGKQGWIDPSMGKSTRTHPLVAAGAKDMLDRSEAERTGITSTYKRLLKIYRDPLIAKNIRTSDFRIMDLIDPAKRVTFYIHMPPPDKNRSRPLVRLILNQILNRLTEKWNPHLEREKNQRPLLLMLDEFPQLGRMEFFESALAYTAGYGIKAFMVCQDLAQVYKEYGHHQSLTSNCDITIVYAPNKLETAQHLSTMLGAKTVIKEAKSFSGNRLGKSVSTSEQEHRRWLMTPDELMRMPASESIIFKNGHRPIHGRKAFYFYDPIFKERALIPPPDSSDKLPVQHDWNYVQEIRNKIHKNSENEELISEALSYEDTDDLL